MIRPGPPSIPPGACPGGVVIHVYAVPSGELITTSAIRWDEDVRAVAERDAAVYDAWTGSDAACLVAYDGDSGRRYPTEAWRGAG